MGNIDISKYDCSCIEQEDGCFLDFMEDMKNRDPFNLLIQPSTKHSSNDITPGGIHYPNDNMIKSQNNIKNIQLPYNKRNSESKCNNNRPRPSVFDYSISEASERNNNKNLLTEDEKDKDIKDLDSKTDYYQLANQISNAINELKANIYINNDETPLPNLKDYITPYKTPNFENNNNNILLKENFENVIKKAGRSADKICFNDIIGCVKKISDICSEVTLTKDRVYLGIVNKFKKEAKNYYFINYEDNEKVVEIPSFGVIKDRDKVKLGKFNDPRFKFNKFSLKGCFPNEILIWKLISQNSQKITDIINDNYYCCLVLLYHSKVEEENETIIYMVNKFTG